MLLWVRDVGDRPGAFVGVALCDRDLEAGRGADLGCCCGWWFVVGVGLGLGLGGRRGLRGGGGRRRRGGLVGLREGGGDPCGLLLGDGRWAALGVQLRWAGRRALGCRWLCLDSRRGTSPVLGGALLGYEDGRGREDVLLA